MLTDMLCEYKKRETYPFHMPGHKGNIDFLPPWLLKLDLTEVDNLDNLNEPEGEICAFLEWLAKIFGVENTEFLTNGSTSGILAAILYAAGDGKEVLVARNCHKSIFNALAIAGGKAHYIYPQNLEYFCGEIRPEDVEAALAANSDVSAVFVTSVTYEGVVSNMQKIAEITHKYGKMLVVDEAHGAHFAFSSYFPPNSSSFADICIQSLHKTLPVLGQSAVVHFGGEFVDKERMRSLVRMVRTSSPSYLLMSQAEFAINRLLKVPTIMLDYVENLDNFRKNVECCQNIQLFNCPSSDKSKLVFLLKNGMNGTEAERLLLEKFNIQIELTGARHIVALTSPADTADGFEQLYRGINALDNCRKKQKNNVYLHNLPKTRTIITLKEAFCRKKTWIELDIAKGRICGEGLTPYPPGVPIVVPGEEFSAEIIETARNLANDGLKINGLVTGKVCVI